MNYLNSMANTLDIINKVIQRVPFQRVIPNLLRVPLQRVPQKLLNVASGGEFIPPQNIDRPRQNELIKVKPGGGFELTPRASGTVRSGLIPLALNRGSNQFIGPRALGIAGTVAPISPIGHMLPINSVGAQQNIQMFAPGTTLGQRQGAMQILRSLNSSDAADFLDGILSPGIINLLRQ
jgi:hypothetical protein